MLKRLQTSPPARFLRDVWAGLRFSLIASPFSWLLVAGLALLMWLWHDTRTRLLQVCQLAEAMPADMQDGRALNWRETNGAEILKICTTYREADINPDLRPRP
jgi:hypothetical protein